MNYWLLKSEPDVWSIDQQFKVGAKGAIWDGVRNHQAAKNLRNMKTGDLCFFYHSNIGKEIVGIVILKTFASLSACSSVSGLSNIIPTALSLRTSIVCSLFDSTNSSPITIATAPARMFCSLPVGS